MKRWMWMLGPILGLVLAPAGALAQVEVAIQPDEAPEPATLEPAVAEASRGSDDFWPYVGLIGGAEEMWIAQRAFTFGSPSVQALDGVSLGSWPGLSESGSTKLVGFGLAIGVRSRGFVRGPELRLHGGGTGFGEDALAPAPDAPDGISLRLRNASFFRAELMAGLQLPLHPVVPYVAARAALGTVWLDVEVEEARLGRLGTEEVHSLLLELGVEVGVSFEIDAFEIGVAFRGNVLGPPIFGAVITLGFGGPALAEYE